MKILAVAYACDPRLGSEPGIGWNWVREIAGRYDCWLITCEDNVELVREYAAREGLSRLRVVGYDLPAWMRFWKRGPGGTSLYFYLWQLGLTRRARELDSEHGFDVAHHLTYSSSWVPSGLARIGKPFVWGPVRQHPRVPDRFILPRDLRQRAAEVAKGWIRKLVPRVDPFMRTTVKRASCILSVGTEGTASIPGRHAGRIEPMLAGGAPVPALRASRFERSEPFRVVFAGRLVDLKGVRLALDAFGRARRSGLSMQLHLAGDGPLRNWLAERARELDVAGDVIFHGQIPLAETHALMESADVFLFPSFEGAGMVVVEAFARGCPVVCLDFGGPAEIVTEQRGIRAPVGGLVDTVAELAGALCTLHRDEDRRQKLARAAYAWARRFATWDYKGDCLEGIYSRATERWREAS